MELPHASCAYHPRACDCDFCRKHGAAYISDPQGAVRIQVKDAQQLGRYRQGSGIAEEVPVSPKTLPDDKKVERWKGLWFADVSIDGDSSK